MAFVIAHDADKSSAFDQIASGRMVQFSTVVGSWRCAVPVVPDGDGADTLPLEVRTSKCRHATNTFVGRVPTCLHHIRVVLPMLCVTEAEVLRALKGCGESPMEDCA